MKDKPLGWWIFLSVIAVCLTTLASFLIVLSNTQSWDWGETREWLSESGITGALAVFVVTLLKRLADKNKEIASLSRTDDEKALDDSDSATDSSGS